MSRIFNVFMLSFFLISCVFVPDTAQKQTNYDKCKMATKKLTLKSKVRSRYKVCDDKGLSEEPLLCLAISGLVGSAAYTVSGSIVVIGNTIHWVEYQSGWYT